MRVFQTLKPGLFTTVQDFGRRGYLKYGISISGAMDTYSLIAANTLVDNSSENACLEITLIGPELQALTRTQIALTGGNNCPRINDHPVSMWQTLSIEEGEVLSFGRMETGCRTYLSIRGGINTPIVLGSRSTNVRGSFGGIGGRRLKTGDIIEAFDTPLLKVERRIPEELIPRFTSSIKAQVILGPQENMFTQDGIETFLSNQYKITPESDRMGYRLEGPEIEHKARADIVSDALLPGAIQVPQSGKPILIMRDAQTTGGYAKIAVTATPDMSKLGQGKPNDTIEFSSITIQEARMRILEYDDLIRKLRLKSENKS